MSRLRSTVEEETVKVAGAMRGLRRKGIGLGVKRWMVVTDTGESRIEDVDKHSIMRRTWLPARDLRVLDPMLSHPSSILGREKAIVVNLEHIKAIITAKQIFMIDSSNPLFLSFIEDLQARLLSSNNEPFSRVSNDMASPLLRSRNDSLSNASEGMCEDTSNNVDVNWGNPKNAEDVAVTPVPKQLPFEFQALESCIESACMCLESETQRLDEEAYPALDELTSHITTLNLERVRQIKNRLVALSGRVQKVADQLEQLLDDDNDMAEMYLTQKLEAAILDQASLKRGYSLASEDIDESDESYSARDKTFDPYKPDVEELEMLLEAYFAQINGMLQKLSSLSEYVDDTEDYINIMLDDKQNQLLQVAIIFNTLNMIVNGGIVAVGLFGMNIHIKIFDGEPAGKFWATAGGTFGACMLVFLFSVWWGKKRYLLSQ